MKQKRGKLTIICGPMFAGKTTALLLRAKSLHPDTYVLFKPSIDTRYSVDECVTHDGERRKAIVVERNAPDFFSHIHEGTRIVFIDELNFFDRDVIYPLVDILLGKGINVIGAGLLYDFHKEPFGATLPLQALSEEVVTITARCDGCGNAANHSYRKVASTRQVMVGAADAYGACCDACWEKLSKT